MGTFFRDGTGVTKNFKKGAEWLKKSAIKGDVDAQRALAELLETGAKGVPKNIAEAKKWMTKAAKQGDKEAKKALRRM